MLGDLEIRKRTGGARSLDDALRAVNRAGGNVGKQWGLDRVLSLADAGTGVEVLGPLRKKMGATAVTVDLDALWKSLGVAEIDGKMVYDEGAPLASVRRAITASTVAGGGPGPTAPAGASPQ
jgi:predicted metalloprotease with PDZ domain